jgi:hypothetical protein
MRTRNKTLTVMMTEEELRKAHALADADDTSVGAYVRKFLEAHFAARFGSIPPPAAKLKPGPKKTT